MSLVRIEIREGKAIIVGAVDPEIVALRQAVDELDEALCDCPFCQQRVMSQEKRCPECGNRLWGQGSFSP